MLHLVFFGFISHLYFDIYFLGGLNAALLMSPLFLYLYGNIVLDWVVNGKR